MRGLRRVADGLGRVEEALAGALVAVIVAVILAQVAARKLFQRPLVWSEECCTYAFMAATLLGAAAATRRGAHVRLSLLADRLPGGSRSGRTLELGIGAVMAALAVGTLPFAATVARLGLRSPSLGLPMAWIYGLVPLSLALIALHLLAGASPPTPEDRP